MNFADKGAVADIEPAFFVGYLYRLKATGTLRFEDAPFQRAIYFRDGRILFASSNAPEDQLGAILVSGGKIGQPQFDAIVAGLEPKQSIAAALAQGGHVSQRDIGDAARRKVEQIVGTCCAQTSGQYEFENGVLPKGALDLKLTTEKVLIAAFEALEPSGFLTRILKSPMAVLAAAELEPVDSELQALRQAVDGESSLADLGGKVGLPLASTEARAAVLVVMGAALVVTSQIEEMALPDTGEDVTATRPPRATPEESGSLARTMNFELRSESEARHSGIEATMAMPVGSGLDGLAEAATATGESLGVPPPSDPSASGAIDSGIPRRAKPSTQELAAMRERLRPLAPQRSGSDPAPPHLWEPMLSGASRPIRSRGGLSQILESPMARGIAGAALIAVLSGVAWIGYTASRPEPAIPAPPTPTSFTPTPAASVSPTGDAGGSSVAPSPFPALSPPLGLSTPATIAQAGTSVSPPVREKPSATPVPKAPSAPAKATPSVPPPPVQSSAYEALKAGRLAEAVLSSERLVKGHGGEFSVQLLVACSPQTIEKAIQNDPSPDLFVLPATVSGKSCHRLMRGLFKTSGEAAQMVSSLPGYYVAEGAKPRAVPLKTLVR